MARFFHADSTVSNYLIVTATSFEDAMQQASKEVGKTWRAYKLSDGVLPFSCVYRYSFTSEEEEKEIEVEAGKALFLVNFRSKKSVNVNALSLPYFQLEKDAAVRYYQARYTDKQLATFEEEQRAKEAKKEEQKEEAKQEQEPLTLEDLFGDMLED